MTSLQSKAVCLDELMPIIRECVESGKNVKFSPRGISMLPMLRQGKDSVVLSRIDGEPKKYDVVLYTGAKNKYTMHRIVGIKGDVYLIRGDNTYVLERVPKENIIGILAEFNRKGKRHTVEDISYKIYSRLRNFTYPVRFVFHKIRRLMAKIYHKIFK